MASNSSVADRLRQQTAAYRGAAQEALGSGRVALQALQGLQVEVIETQQERIEELEQQIAELKQRNLDLVSELEIYKFKERSRSVEELRQQFPSKKRRRR